MRIILSLFVIFSSTTPAPFEEQITFDMTYQYCVKYATHIVKGKIIDARGTVKINELWLGNTNHKKLIFNQLSTPSQLGGYGPNGPLIGWEVILFLRKSPIDGNLYPIKFYAETEEDADWTSEELNTMVPTFLRYCMVFSKEENLFYGVQKDNPGDVIFIETIPEERLRNNVLRDLKAIETNLKLRLINFYFKKYKEGRDSKTTKTIEKN